jgi:hypothetical protein
LTLRDNQSSTKLLRATIIAAIIIRPRHCLAILIAAHFLPRLPRYNLDHRLLGISPGTVRVLFGWKVGLKDRF